MSWLFSQALVAAYSEENFWDGELSAQLNVMPTPQQFWRNDKMMDCSIFSLFGLTLQLLTEQNGGDLLMWFQEVFLARISASLEQVQELTENDLDCGKKWPGSLAKYDPHSHTWKTHQYSLLEDLTEFSETWPKWGMTVDGELYPQPIAVQTISAKGSGLWATPCASYADRSGRGDLLMQVRGNSSPSGRFKLPTPTANNYGSNKSKRGARRRPSLQQMARENLWPTPGANDWKSATGWDPQKQKEAGHTPQLRHVAGGQLNPPWVEWLMGWPIGWTDLKPLEMDKFQSWLQQHGEFLQENEL